MSASARNNLPSEIVEAILPLLPAKCLGRFKSVSKTWDSLISDPQFIKTHLHRHKTSKLIVGGDLGILQRTRFSERRKRYDVLDESNHTRAVESSPFSLPVEESLVKYGFGYDSSTDVYNVVSISFWDPHSEHDTDMHASVYSLRNNSWRQLPNSHYGHDIRHITISGVLINQKLHWYATAHYGFSSIIVAFSLANEEFNIIELPDSIANDKAVFNELVVLGGKLGLYVCVGVGYDLWVMGEYGVAESWTRVCIEIGPCRPV
ncbi:hypothetical protein L1987_43635 [Smallanthus sonchifolius]|uniref:Uncharacterized protein n=1 Tax=Smallanthus sonchifolius TaxID=185202 RepID=A0ACB9GMW6_9ASTR|nr:hypothetical protein L1987_43635 [Smallanthus sonchifolius]